VTPGRGAAPAIQVACPASPRLTRAWQLRRAVNLVNGSTVAGLAVARAGRATLAPGHDGLTLALGYRLPVPTASAFCLGNVIITRLGPAELGAATVLLAHEARHATQYAWCAGLAMLPAYFLCAGVSWLLTGDFATWNVFERRAGLAEGGYSTRPLRWQRGS
jgi:hypothetical protein